MSKQRIDVGLAVALEVTTDWVLSHPAARVDIMLPAAPRTGFEVGLRTAQNDRRLSCHIRTSDAPGEILDKLDRVLARVRRQGAAGPAGPVLNRPAAHSDSVH
jgi:hypothetical protein